MKRNDWREQGKLSSLLVASLAQKLEKLRAVAILCLVLLLSVLSLAFLALAQGSGLVEGDVLNGSKGNEPVPGITVTLRIFDSSGAEKGTLTATTDEQGHFAFKGLDTAKSLLYVAVANFQGISYQSPALSFAEGEDKLLLPILVYETTESDAEIVVEKAHFIFSVNPEEKAVLAMEMYSVANNGNRTFVTKEGKSLRFPIPPEVLEFDSDSLVLEGGEAFLHFPVPPGSMPQPVTLYYLLPAQGDSVEIKRQVLYPVESYNVFVKDSGLKVEVPGARRGKDVVQAGEVYLNFAGEKLPKGGEITIKFSGLGKVGKAQSSGILWASATAAGVALALFGLLLAYTFARRR